MGINIDNVISITFIIGSALAAIGAIMYGIRYPGITPMMGVMPGLKCFIAAVIGGIGNIKGAVLGGFILGLGEILIVAFFPDLSGYRPLLLLCLLLFCFINLLAFWAKKQRRRCNYDEKKRCFVNHSRHNCPFRACVFRSGGNGLLYPQNC